MSGGFGVPVGEPIEDLLHRRNDLSTFLVHFTREFEGSARANALSIMTTRSLEARSVYGIMRGRTEGNATLEATQKVVCFTETPVEHSWMMLKPTDPPRGVQLAPYGLVFPKVWGRRHGVNPVWYIDMTPGGKGVWRHWLINYLDELREAAAAGHAVRQGANGTWNAVAIEDSQIAGVAPFVEQMVPAGTHIPRKEFWWEREWRHRGNLAFDWNSVVAVFAPAEDHDAFLNDLHVEEAKAAQVSGRASEQFPRRRLLDPTWGLERMIARLAEIADADAGPLP
ncbi:MAG: hypothetical protein ACXVES_10795 [Actinomycetota bacterium]